MSTGNVFWCGGLTPLSLSYASCPEIWEPHPAEILRACPNL